MPDPTIRLMKATFAPPVAEYALVTAGTRDKFWAQFKQLALKIKDEESAAGIDCRTGAPFVAISAQTYEDRKDANYSPMGKADPIAPPLTPCYGLSRTRAWLRGRVEWDSVVLFWENDWGKVLDFHRSGAHVFHAKWRRWITLPRRDAIGISPAGQAKLKAEALRLWRGEARRMETHGHFVTAPPAVYRDYMTRQPAGSTGGTMTEWRQFKSRLSPSLAAARGGAR